MTLMEKWDQRDEQYRKRKHLGMKMPLSKNEISIVVWWRTQEAKELPPYSQLTALERLVEFSEGGS